MSLINGLERANFLRALRLRAREVAVGAARFEVADLAEALLPELSGIALAEVGCTFVDLVPRGRGWGLWDWGSGLPAILSFLLAALEDRVRGDVVRGDMVRGDLLLLGLSVRRRSRRILLGGRVPLSSVRLLVRLSVRLLADGVAVELTER